MMNTIDKIKQVCRQVEAMLIDKNKSYGDSALNPLGIFASGDPVANLTSRIDDKLARIKTLGFDGFGEDNVQDLMGYLVLLQIAINDQKNENK
jgi:hypothetical protein